METSSLVSVQAYLSTSYSPDREYLDGVILERNLGEIDHSAVQGELITWLNNRRKAIGIWVFPEQRVQVQQMRFRVPDVCVVAGSRPRVAILTAPPFLCVEILSKDDRLSEMQERIDDYLAFGVPYVWLIDPARRRAWVHTADGSHEAKERVLRTVNPEIAVPLDEIFAAL